MSLREGREPHSCLASDIAIWRKTLAADKDSELLTRIKTWPEFKRPLGDNMKIWRMYCGMNRREAARRGLT